MNSVHLIYTPFSGVGLHGGFRGDTWYKRRIEIFKNYCLKSLLNQTNRDFIHWISFRSEEEYNPLTIQFASYLQGIGYPFVMTFHNLMYHDDKFSNYTVRTKIRNVLMMLRDSIMNNEWHNPSYYIRHAWENKNSSLIERTESSLRILQEMIGTNWEWVYLTRIDSDDMLRYDAIELIQNQEPGIRKALVFRNGYIFNKQTGQVADWNPPTNPPFHTIIFPGIVFFSAQNHVEYYKDFRSHEDILRLFDCTVLDDEYCVLYHGQGQIGTSWSPPLDKQIKNAVQYGQREPFRGKEYKGYCYLTHGKNISTSWESRRRKIRNKMIGDEYFEQPTKEAILKQFGIV